jgi:hypothetical protein
LAFRAEHRRSLPLERGRVVAIIDRDEPATSGRAHSPSHTNTARVSVRLSMGLCDEPAFRAQSGTAPRRGADARRAAKAGLRRKPAVFSGFRDCSTPIPVMSAWWPVRADPRQSRGHSETPFSMTALAANRVVANTHGGSAFDCDERGRGAGSFAWGSWAPVGCQLGTRSLRP